MKFRFPRRRARRDKYAVAAAELGNALGQSLRLGAPLAIKHEHVYGARPPLPKPARMMVCWQLQNGTELKNYVSMYGQRQTVMSWPRFLDPNWPPVLIRFEYEYDER